MRRRLLRAASAGPPEVHLPRTREDDFAYFEIEDLGDAVRYYRDEGYVVLRNLIAPEYCDRVRIQFANVGRHARTPILRQKNMRYERNRLTPEGFLDNPIFNVQDLNTQVFGAFKIPALDILTHARVAQVTQAILGGPPKVVQSMFFEAAAGTWAHQDSYYQDSYAELGGMTAGWYALEDIDADAGRFFVCPRSHRQLALIRNDGRQNFASGHEVYKKAISEAMAAAGCQIRAPYMAKGDVLFWSSLTVHGSLEGARGGVSRASLTAHYLRADDQMLQFHSRVRRQKTRLHNGMAVALLHDQDRLKNRAIGAVSFAFPGVVEQVRRLAMRAVIQGKKAPRAPLG